MFSTRVFKGKAHPKMEVRLHTSYRSLGVWQTQKWCVFFFFQWTYVKGKTYITEVIYVIKSGYLSVVLEFLKPIPRISCAINDGPKAIIFWGQLKNKEQTKKTNIKWLHKAKSLSAPRAHIDSKRRNLHPRGWAHAGAFTLAATVKI